ncbi:hypothetical protein ACFL2Q_13955 [Thermodesulfobacteriota bacterium]
MIRPSRLWSPLIVIAFLCTPCGVRADLASLSKHSVTGGAAFAKSAHETIRMKSEEVRIRLEKLSFTVEAVFNFFNSGENTTEWVGFPKLTYGSESTTDAWRDFVQFHAWVDDKPSTFTNEDNRWMAREVTFPGKAKTTIRVMYEAEYMIYWGHYAEYIIGTGASWKGSIGKAVLIIDCSATGGSENLTARLVHGKARRTVTENTVRLDLSDFEPKPDEKLYITVDTK